jgi:hypothetical protein
MNDLAASSEVSLKPELRYAASGGEYVPKGFKRKALGSISESRYGL